MDFLNSNKRKTCRVQWTLKQVYIKRGHEGRTRLRAIIIQSKPKPLRIWSFCLTNPSQSRYLKPRSTFKYLVVKQLPPLCALSNKRAPRDVLGRLKVALDTLKGVEYLDFKERGWWTGAGNGDVKTFAPKVDSFDTANIDMKPREGKWRFCLFGIAYDQL